MSHIDSYKHEIVGRFGPLPVYHPLEDIESDEHSRDTGDFGCTTGQLVIGGGSGEHPGLVLKKPQVAVAHYALTLKRESWRDPCLEVLRTQTYRGVLEYSGWSIDTYQRFHEICTSPALYCPYDYEQYDGFDDWLMLGLGEFVFNAMPDLARPLMEKLDDPYGGDRHHEYSNIMILPPNMPTYANGGHAFAITRRNISD